MVDSSDLVTTILTRTREGKLSWEELSSTGFLTRVGYTMIVVDRGRPDASPTMRITDETGKVLEVINGPIYSTGGILGTTTSWKKFTNWRGVRLLELTKCSQI
jgi:hypothetical protein